MTDGTYVETLARAKYNELVAANDGDRGETELPFLAWCDGFMAAVEAYAVWADGEQLVGVQREPIGTVRDELDRVVGVLNVRGPWSGCELCGHPATVHTRGGCGVVGCDCRDYIRHGLPAAEGRTQGPADPHNPETNHRAQRADGTHERHRGPRESCSLCNQ